MTKGQVDFDIKEDNDNERWRQEEQKHEESGEEKQRRVLC